MFFGKLYLIHDNNIVMLY